MTTAKNKYGLSKKTNIGLAAIGGITAASTHWPAILAAYAITLQYRIDRGQK